MLVSLCDSYKDPDYIYPKLQRVKIGSSVNITCTSMTNTYWYRNDYNIFAKGNHLHIPSVDRTTEGYYICKGTTKKGNTFWSRSEVYYVGK